MNLEVKPGQPGSASALAPVLLLENRPLASMRGIAALCVVYYHTMVYFFQSPGAIMLQMRGWYLCVDLFFVLSGLVMARVYWQLEPAKWRDFYIKRFFRIYPVHFVTMMVLGAIVLAAQLAHIHLKSEFDFRWQMFLPVLTLTQTIVSDYNAGWNRPTWALADEIVCYALFPLAIWAGRNADSKSKWAGVALLLVMAVLDGLWQGDYNYGYHTYLRAIAAFLTGLVAFINVRHVPLPNFWSNTVVQAIALAGLFYCLFTGAPFAFGISALLVASLYFDTGVAAVITRPLPLVWLGRQSFSMYIIHMPVIDIFGKVLDMAGLKGMPPMLIVGATFLAVIVASMVCYHFVETPFRRLPVRLGMIKPSERELAIAAQGLRTR
jgi:peptidoglycan/LPS O-acetylase OafA/YrhL